jgi:hypothetical protein
MVQMLKDDIADKIYCSAIDEFYERGYKSTPIRDIAKGAGVSVGLIYTYYENKEALFEAVVKPTYLLIKNILSTINNTGNPPFDRNYSRYIHGSTGFSQHPFKQGYRFAGSGLCRPCHRGSSSCSFAAYASWPGQSCTDGKGPLVCLSWWPIERCYSLHCHGQHFQVGGLHCYNCDHRRPGFYSFDHRPFRAFRIEGDSFYLVEGVWGCPPGHRCQTDA